ncbi:cupin domain-containing protein [Halobellus inordinatus]|uniref:cupin domain-containing protein n=1 Tax=Halobellus inordinatus TaxID=1126236 RepID=UPI002114D915|nr:cupin domain-containing protein [Halobellus ramosii]
MGYHVVDSETVSPADGRPCELRRLGGAAGLSNVAVNRFRAEPGEQLPLKYHYHEEQEEAFYVLSGTMHVETPEETFVVDTDELFAVDPESPQRAYNPADADTDLVVLAVGAPAVDGDAVAYDPAASDAE